MASESLPHSKSDVSPLRPRSTFGSSSKAHNQLKDDKYNLSIEDWTVHDELHNTHGRPRVVQKFGKLTSTPHAGEYNPSLDPLSIFESPPKYTLSSRHHPKVVNAQEVPGPGTYEMTPGMSSERPVKTYWRKQKNPIAPPGFPVGPGSHSPTEKYSTKFALDPRPVLAPHTTQKSRMTIDLRNLKIPKKIPHRVGPPQSVEPDLGPGYYADAPILHATKQVTIGLRRPLLGQKEILSPGPGDYEPDYALFGSEPLGRGVITNQNDIHSKHYSEKMLTAPRNSNSAQVKTGVWIKGKTEARRRNITSPYAINTKHPTLQPRYTGKTYTSTVQNYAQHFKGKNSPGKFMKIG